MSSGELTSGVDTPKGKKKPKRHPWDWYVEQPWVTEQLIETLPANFFDGQLIWDPACGGGNILSVFRKAGHPIMGSDRFSRVGGFVKYRNDFLAQPVATLNTFFPEITSKSIVSNPPYSMQGGKIRRGLAEEFCRRAIEISTHRVCMLLPLKWMAGEARQRFLIKYPPRFYLILNQRPSMPPGNMIEKLGDRAFKRGKVDYMWVVWDKQVVTLPGETRTIHIAPRPKAERV